MRTVSTVPILIVDAWKPPASATPITAAAKNPPELQEANAQCLLFIAFIASAVRSFAEYGAMF